jgi:hypothetical protein
MRTTIRIDDDLVAELKRRAGDEPITRVLNEVLRRGIEAMTNDRDRYVREYREETYDLGVPNVDLTKALRLSFSLDDEKFVDPTRSHALNEAG